MPHYQHKILHMVEIMEDQILVTLNDEPNYYYLWQPQRLIDYATKENGG